MIFVFALSTHFSNHCWLVLLTLELLLEGGIAEEQNMIRRK